MNDNTEIITKPDGSKPESKLFGVSLRGLISLTVICTICGMSLAAIEVREPLYTLGGMIVAFYFGQNQRPQKTP